MAGRRGYAWRNQLRQMLQKNDVDAWLREDRGVDRPGSRLRELHWSTENGIGWRWRLLALCDAHDAHVSKDDLADAVSRAERDAKGAKSHRKTITGLLSNGTRPFSEERRATIERFLFRVAGLNARDYFNKPIWSEAELLASARDATFTPSRPDLDALADDGVWILDDRRDEMFKGLRRFLSHAKSDPGSPFRCAQMLYSEHSRALQYHVRSFLSDYQDDHNRRVVSLDCRAATPDDLIEKLCGARTDTSSQGQPMREMASTAIDSLEKSPAIVVLTNFEPVLMGLEGASVRAACRTLGVFDLFSRIAKGNSGATRFILLVPQQLSTVNASYLFDVRRFAAVAPDTPHLRTYLARIYETQKPDQSDYTDDLCRNIQAAGQFPNDTMLAMINALQRREDVRLPAGELIEAIRSNAQDWVCSLLLHLFRDDRLTLDILCVTALAEDRLRRDSLYAVLLRLNGGDSAGDRTDERYPDLIGGELMEDHLREPVTRLKEVLPTLFFEDSIKLHPHSPPEPMYDLEPVFRAALLRVLERNRFRAPAEVMTAAEVNWVRRQIADRAEQFMEIELSSASGEWPIRRSVVQFGILAVLLWTQSLQSEPERPAEDRRGNSTTGSGGRNDAGAQTLKRAVAVIDRLERCRGKYTLSASHLGLQTKLQLWLLIQRVGQPRTRAAAHYSHYHGSALATPHPLPRFFDEKENVEMLTSLAVGAMELNLGDFAEQVVSTASAYLQTARSDAAGRANRGLDSSAAKLHKMQADLLVSKGFLTEAEFYIRNELSAYAFYEAFPLGWSIRASQTGPTDLLRKREGESLDPRQMLVWSRLLVRLGVILSQVGGLRHAEARESFELARQLDNACQQMSGSTTCREVGGLGLRGKGAQTYFRLLCESAVTRRQPDALRLCEEARSIRRLIYRGKDQNETRTASPDSPRYRVENSIDEVYSRLIDARTDAPAGTWLENWLRVANNEIARLSALRDELRGERLLGSVLCHLYSSQALIAAYSALAVCHRLPRGDQPPRAEITPTILKLLMKDGDAPVSESVITQGRKACAGLNKAIVSAGSGDTMTNVLVEADRQIAELVFAVVRIYLSWEGYSKLDLENFKPDAKRERRQRIKETSRERWHAVVSQYKSTKLHLNRLNYFRHALLIDVVTNLLNRLIGKHRILMSVADANALLRPEHRPGEYRKLKDAPLAFRNGNRSGDTAA